MGRIHLRACLAFSELARPPIGRTRRGRLALSTDDRAESSPYQDIRESMVIPRGKSVAQSGVPDSQKTHLSLRISNFYHLRLTLNNKTKERT